MATVSRTGTRPVDYPTSDGRPLGETDLHRNRMVELIDRLTYRYRDRPDVYVTGNLLFFYQEGDRRKHVSPDLAVVFGVPKRLREHYLIWEEGKAPDLVIEVTSKTTRREDRVKKLNLYRDVMKVPEYFRFDPREEYLKPPLQGSRLVEGEYVPIDPVNGRFPSAILGLELERAGDDLRLYDPATGSYLPTQAEAAESRLVQVETARHEAEIARVEADATIRRLMARLAELEKTPPAE